MRHFLTLLLFSCSLLAVSDNGFSVIIEQPAQGTLFDIVEESDGTLSAVGTIDIAPQKSSDASYSSAFEYLSELRQNSGEHMSLVRVGTDGQILLNRTLALPYLAKGSALLQLDGGYLLAGESADGRLALVHVANNGALRSEQRFGSAATDRISRIIHLRDGGTLVVGSSMSNRVSGEATALQGLGENDIFLTRFSKEMRLLWSKKYGTTGEDEGIDAAQQRDGSIILLSTTLEKGEKHALLLRLHESGETLAKVTLPAPLSGAYDLLALRNGTYLLSLGQLNQKNREQIRLVRIDGTLQIVADRTLASEENRRLYALAERSDGSLAAAGIAFGGTHADNDALALRLDAQLAPLWQRRFGDRNSDAFHALCVLKDGSFALAGTRTSADQESAYRWILKLNDDGSVALKQSDASSLYKALCDTFSKEIAAGEVAIARDLTVSLRGSGLYFQPGVYALNSAQKQFLERFGPKLFTALQPYKNSIAHLNVNGHTSSEWRGAGETAVYLNNMELSTQRAFAVLSELFAKPEAAPYRQWLSKSLQNNGHAYAKVLTKETNDGKMSRRVDFSIVMK